MREPDPVGTENTQRVLPKTTESHKLPPMPHTAASGTAPLTEHSSSRHNKLVRTAVDITYLEVSNRKITE